MHISENTVKKSLNTQKNFQYIVIVLETLYNKFVQKPLRTWVSTEREGCKSGTVSHIWREVWEESIMSKQMSDKARSGGNIAKFILLNAIGIFMLFITLSIVGKSFIPIDHIVT